jgi:exosortase
MQKSWLAIAITAVVLAICYASTLNGMIGQWTYDEDMGHGFLVTPVVLWILWRERPKWSAIPAKPSWWGVVILAAAALMHVIGILGGGLFVSSVAMLVSIVGVIVCFAGFARLRAWSFPLLVSLFMLPKLAIVYNQFTLPLQLLASRMAAGILTTAGAAVVRQGNILDVGGHKILVEEACNGIRYLLPLGFIGVVLAYMLDKRGWMRLALLVAAVPIAICANAVRVALAGAMPVFAEGTPHALSGVVIFVLCLAALIVVHRFFSRFRSAHA